MPANPSNFLAIATAGHVDHGKTSLVRHLTGTDTDTLAEEKARGLTINTGFAYRRFSAAPAVAEPAQTSGQDYTLGFVDVPGHHDFINNMLAGVSSVGAALLVIAADDGIMPQTREHLAIIDLLGIRVGAVAISKVDRCNPQDLATLKAEIMALLEGTGLDGAPLFEIDNLSGAGISKLASHLESLALTSHTAESTLQQHPRFLVDRAFAAKGFGTIVTGTTLAGPIELGSELQHTGSGKSAKVRGIRLDHETLSILKSGQRGALNITLDHGELSRGDTLGSDVQRVFRFDAELRLLPAVNAKPPALKPGVNYHLYLGASHRLVQLRRLSEDFVQFSIDKPLSCHWGDRFVLRDPQGRYTLGGGRVISVDIPRRGRASPERLAQLRAETHTAEAALTALLKLPGPGVELTSFARARNLTPKALAELVALQQASAARPLLLPLAEGKQQLIALAQAQSYEASLLEALANFHSQQPSASGCDQTLLQRSCEAPNLLHPALLDALAAKGKVVMNGSLWALASFRQTKSREREEFEAKILPLLLRGGLTPPRTREIVEATGIPLKGLERLLQQCAREGAVVWVADNRCYLPQTLTQLAEQAQTLADSKNGDGFSVIEFRDATGMGRNLCIEVLEHFDACGFTQRRDNVRVLRREWAA